MNVLLIGDGPDRGLLEDQARRLRLEDRVCFYGACYDEEEIGPLLSLSTLCVCPGHTGLTAIHAMAYGIPVITHDDLSAHAPESEVIEPGSNGDLYDSTDDADLCRCVADWLSSDRDRSQVRKRCIDSVERHYTPEVQTDLIAGFLQEDATRG